MTENTINTEVTMRDAVPTGGAKRFRPGDEILGRYVVETELGQGGMGVVYLCLDKVAGVKVAVKGLPPEVSHNSDEMESVRENFQLVSELQHPNIAGVRTLEVDASTGNYYLIMAYARGTSLKHWLRQHGGKKHRAEHLKVLRQIASALDYAHNAEPRHIIHRDIKPENIMVDERGNVSVLDFGLAAQVRSSLSRITQVVTSRSGTPAYKSPEQWLAQAQRAPSDQYSLGVIAYQMFAGELPYDSDDIEILKHAVVFDPVLAISGEGKAVNAVFAKVLAKRPQDRFASCSAFVDALEGRKPAQDATSSGKRIAVGVGVLALAILVGAGGWRYWQMRQTADQERLAEISRQRAESERRVKKELSRIAESERKAREVAAESAAFELSSRAESAHDLIGKETAETKAFFESEIRAFENDRRAGEGAKALSKNVIATNFLTQALAKATALKAMVVNRATYLSAIAKADEARKMADEVGAGTALALRYGEAKQLMESTTAAVRKRDFISARATADRAAGLFTLLRRDVVRVSLDRANRHKAAERWQECLSEAEKILAWNPGDAEAVALKNEAAAAVAAKKKAEQIARLEARAKDLLAKEEWSALQRLLDELVKLDAENAIFVKCKEALRKARVQDDEDLKNRMLVLCRKPENRYNLYRTWASEHILTFDFKHFDKYNSSRGLRYSILADAIWLGADLPIIQYLVETKGIRVEEVIGSEEKTALFVAVEQDNLETVRYLLGRGADANRKEKFAGMVPLYYAKSIGVAKALHDAGAQCDVVMRFDSGLPFYVADGKKFDVMRFLCAHGSPLKDRDALYRKAAEAGDLEFLKDHPDEVHRLPALILHAVKGGNLDMVKWLEAEGQSLAHVDKEGRTALHFCGSTNTTLSAYKYAWERCGHEVTERDKHGRTPLHCVESGEVAKFLLDHGADVAAMDEGGETPLHGRDNAEVVKALLERGADVNARDKCGATPVVKVFARENEEAFKIFVVHGADLNVVYEKCDYPDYNRLASCVLQATGVRKKALEYEVETVGQLKYAMAWCENGSVIKLKNGDYRSLRELRVEKSVTLRGESRDSVVLGSACFDAGGKSGDCAISVVAVTFKVKHGSVSISDVASVEFEDSVIESQDDHALYHRSCVGQVVLRNCLLKGHSEYGTYYCSTHGEDAVRSQCFGTEFRNDRGPAVNIGGKGSRFYWEDCKFFAPNNAEAAFNNSYDVCPLFNSCAFKGGKMGIRHGAAKCYNCTFSGKMSESDAVVTVERKLTEGEIN